MSPTQTTPEKSNPVAAAGLAAQPHRIAAANADDVMRDQLEFLIEHAQNGACGCALCHRYQRTRSLLLEVFG